MATIIDKNNDILVNPAEFLQVLMDFRGWFGHEINSWKNMSQFWLYISSGHRFSHVYKRRTSKLLDFKTIMARLGSFCLCVALVITALMTVSLKSLLSIFNSLWNYTTQDLFLRWLISLAPNSLESIFLVPIGSLQQLSCFWILPVDSDMFTSAGDHREPVAMEGEGWI